MKKEKNYYVYVVIYVSSWNGKKKCIPDVMNSSDDWTFEDLLKKTQSLKRYLSGMKVSGNAFIYAYVYEKF